MTCAAQQASYCKRKALSPCQQSVTPASYTLGLPKCIQNHKIIEIYATDLWSLYLKLGQCHDTDNATTVPQQCHNSATTVPRQCYDSATTMLRQCHDSATTVPRQCHDNATTVPRQCYGSATTMLRQCRRDSDV